MSLIVMAADQATMISAAVQDNCTLVTPIADPLLQLAGSVTGFLKWGARIVFVVALFCLLIPSKAVRIICFVTLGTIVGIGLFAPGLIGLGEGLIPSAC